MDTPIMSKLFFLLAYGMLFKLLTILLVIHQVAADCSDAYEYTVSWDAGATGALYVEFPEDTSEWEVEVIFSSPITSFDTWFGTSVECTDTVCKFNNQDYNGQQYAGNELTIEFLIYFSEQPDIVGLTLNGEDMCTCPIDDPNYASIGGTCYYFDTVGRTKDEAQENCNQNYGKLWEPSSIEIINQVYAKAQDVSEAKYWVGVSDAASEGTFQFESDGEIFPFTDFTAPWEGTEPNGGETENCVAMGMDNYGFFDVKCADGRTYPSICEISMYLD